MAHIEMNLGPLGQGSIIIDGVDLSRYVKSITLDAGVGYMPELTLNYACIDATKIEGEAHVIHYCPYRDESSSESSDA